ncbi:L,D-transpeptidase [Gordonia sp. TBRC 11910]|uniref:L,D-transpeptidase n=1 Tax=Gordonia asplenii TaxID=2725283 RepID=A0A848KYJ8_9ACTN|nr:Ig-like domain-containing protein [Gordonia asplenii]NMO03760.1 L,D-transpeptidase [Gordonia asplenii]
MTKRSIQGLLAVTFAAITVVSLSSCTKSPSYSDAVDAVGSFNTFSQPELDVTGWQDKPLPDSAVGVMPGAPITVKAHNGDISQVSVVGPDGAVKGKVSDDGASWVSSSALDYGAKYTLTAAARGVNGENARKISFSTSSAQNFAAATSVTDDGETVGVGQTVSINFDAPVANKRNAQNAIKVTTNPPVEGAFYWINDSMVRWRPEHFFTPGTKVSVAVRTKGIDLGDGTFGQNNLNTNFTVGRRMVSTVDDKSKIIKVWVNNKVVRTMPTSMGKDSTPTNTGIYMVAERVPSVVMDSSTYGVPVNSPGGYKEVVYYASRISFSGIYVHSAPWSLGDQGVDDVSNGCLNVSPDNAQWFMNHSLRGDVVEVAGTVGPTLPGDDGLGDWNVPWAVWKKGNA